MLIKGIKIDMDYIAKIQVGSIGVKRLFPFFIKLDGCVGKQVFWEGRPYELLGFNDKPITGKISLAFKIFKQDINKAIGMYPVFRNKDGSIETVIVAVESVKG